MLTLGIWAGRGVKSMRDYAVANRSYSAPVMSIAFLATMIGGTSTIGFVESIHKDGIILLIADLGFVFSYMLIALWIAPRIHRFSGLISVGEIMKVLYGKNAQLLTSIVGFFYCTIVLAGQCKAIGYLMHATFGFNQLYAIILGASVFTIYSTFGGIRSVTITDLFQFAILIIVIPLVANIFVADFGNIGALVAQVPAEKFTVFGHEKFWEFVVLTFVWGIFPAFALGPAPIQRMLMLSEVKSIRTMYMSGSLMIIPMDIIVALIGFSALIAFPDIQSGLAFPTIINEVLPPIVRGVTIAGLLAVIMSTADSYLNSGAILFVHDFLKMRVKNAKIPELAITKIATVLMGIGGVLLAINTNSIIQLGFYSASLWGPMIVIPLIYGILGYSSSDKAFVWASVSTFTSFVLAQILLPEGAKYWSGLISIAINGISFFYFTHLFKSKNKKLDDKYIYESPKKVSLNILRSLRRITPYRVLEAINEAVSRVGASHLIFGIFCGLNYIIPYFMWMDSKSIFYYNVLVIRAICCILCLGLIIEYYWPKSLKKYFNLYWYFALIFCLPFSTTVISYIQEFNPYWMVNIALSIFLLSLLVEWVSFLVITALGIIAGYCYLRYMLPAALFPLNSEQIYLVIYIMIFATLIGLFFSRRREIIIDSRIDALREETGVIAHDLKAPLSGVMAVAEMQKFILNQSKINTSGANVLLEMQLEDYQMLKKSSDLIERSVIAGRTSIDNLFISSSAVVPDSQKRLLSIKECFKSAFLMLTASGYDEKSITLQIDNDIRFMGSELFVSHMLFNLLSNSIKHNGSDIAIDIRVSANKVTIRDNGKGIPQKYLPKLFERGFSLGEGTGVGLSFCKMVMDDLGGSIFCKSQPGKYTEFTLVF